MRWPVLVDLSRVGERIAIGLEGELWLIPHLMIGTNGPRPRDELQRRVMSARQQVDENPLPAAVLSGPALTLPLG
ncbi:MAG: hypothetical protein AB7I59_20300 [Geminicoccaceae bacterium]